MMSKTAKLSHIGSPEKISKQALDTSGYRKSGIIEVSLTRKPKKSGRAPEKILDLTGDRIAFVNSASKMELRKRYPAEANTHRNMKERAKKCGKTVSSSIVDFRDFLLLVGPMPSPRMTLDRVDNDDPEYAPGKVRWATAKVQNNNKGDTLKFTHSRNCRTFTTSELAQRFNVTTDAIRKRRRGGWTDDEIIEGKRSSQIPQPQPPVAPKHILTTSKFPSGLYTPQHLAMLNRPEEELTRTKDIEFHREAYLQQALREAEGMEPIVMIYSEMRQFPAFASVTEEQCERHFLKSWPTKRPHTIYANLTPEQQQFLHKVDAAWAKKQEEKLKLQQSLAAAI